MMESFDEILGLEPTANLVFDNRSYSGFIMIDHNLDAIDVQENIRDLNFISDSFLALPDNFIVFSTRSMSLRDLLNDPAFPTKAKYKGRMTDYLKILLRNLGLIMMRCLVLKIAMDFKPERVYVTTSPYLQVKALAIKGDAPEFSKYKRELLDLYKEIMSVVYPNTSKASSSSSSTTSKASSSSSSNQDPEYEDFIKKLEKCSTLGEVKVIFESWLFWDGFKRLAIIANLGELTRMCSGAIHRNLRSTELPGWRAKFERHPIIKALMSWLKEKNEENRDSALFVQREVDLLLLLLRASKAHFRSANTKFTDEMQMLKYLEYYFPKIMSDVYQGCQLMQDRHDKVDGSGFNFDLNSWKK